MTCQPTGVGVGLGVGEGVDDGLVGLDDGVGLGVTTDTTTVVHRPARCDHGAG